MLKASGRVHVAVGVIRDTDGRVLVSRRAEHLHQGGLWEFPGGKREAGETIREALQRELHEELGIRVTCAEPFLRISHDYPDKSVLLDVWQVTAFEGTPQGLQGQPLSWLPVKELTRYTFPPANRPIITALRLPRQMLVTGEWRNLQTFEHRLGRALRNGIRLVQLRAHGLNETEYLQLCARTDNLCRQFGALWVANTDVSIQEGLGADGLHLTSARLMTCTERPVPRSVLFGASCHSLEEIRHAERVDADYITLGPVLPTASHPGAVTLGMEGFARLCGSSGLPVFALGGMHPELLGKVTDAGGFGLAGIGCYWRD